MHVHTETRVARFTGVETGNMEVVEFLPGAEPPTIMLKEQGSYYWSRRGNTSYSGALYRALEVLGMEPVAERSLFLRLRVKEVIDAPLRPKPKQLEDLSKRLQAALAGVTGA